MSSRVKRKKKRLGRQPPGQPDHGLLGEAMRQHAAGQVEAAAAIYRRILASSPEHADALHFLGVAEHQLGDSEAALLHLGRALALAPNHADALSNRGKILQERGRLEDAEADYRRALAQRPDDANALNNLGTVLRRRGDLEGAVAALRRAIALKPGLAGAWQNLGNALGALDRIDEAIAAHREAMRLAPQAADSYRNLGRMLYAIGRIDEAAQIYQQWLALFPDDPRAQHSVASCTGTAVPARASDDYVRAEFDDFAATFDASLARLEYRAPALLAEASRRLYPDAAGTLAVLDVGCGTGLCGPLLRPLAKQLTGVDLSTGMIELARQRSVYDELVVAELTAHLQACPDRYDLVLSADTLVYFGDLGAVAAAAARALRAGGALTFTVEAATPEQAPAGFRLNPHGRYSHTRAYLLDVLARAGLRDSTVAATTLRKEAGRWVDGFLATARAPAP